MDTTKPTLALNPEGKLIICCAGCNDSPETCKDCTDNMVGLSLRIVFTTSPVHDWTPGVGTGKSIQNAPVTTSIPTFNTVPLDPLPPTQDNGSRINQSNHTVQAMLIAGTQSEHSVVLNSDGSFVEYRSIAYIAFNFSCYCDATQVGIWSGAPLVIQPIISPGYQTSGSPPAYSTWVRYSPGNLSFYGMSPYNNCDTALGPFIGDQTGQFPAVNNWSNLGTMQFTPSDLS